MGTCRWTPPDSARPGAGGEEPEPAAGGRARTGSGSAWRRGGAGGGAGRDGHLPHPTPGSSAAGLSGCRAATG